MSLEGFLPDPPKPATDAEIDAALHMFQAESLRKNPHFTKDQHLDYIAQATAIWLNL